MNSALKQRLVGALVLISLAIIFLPMVFDEPRSSVNQRIIPIPQKPPVAEIRLTPAEPPPGFSPVPAEQPLEAEAAPAPLAEPTGGQQEAAAATPEPKQAPAPKVANNNPPEPSPKTVQNVASGANTTAGAGASTPAGADKTAAAKLEPVAWSIRLGSFGDNGNVESLQKRLRAEQLTPYTRRITGAEGNLLTQVFVGPYTSKSEAEGVKQKVDKRFKVNSLIVRYNVGS